jgi:hypothetical protein
MKRTWTIIGVNDVRSSFKWILPKTRTEELTLRDPDGCYVTISAL